MGRLRNVGRAHVRHVGKAKVSRTRAVVSARDDIRTYAIRLDNEPPPVFVDSSGRRRHRLRYLAVYVCTTVLLLIGGLWLSQAGNQVGPEPVPPCATPQAARVGAVSPVSPAAPVSPAVAQQRCASVPQSPGPSRPAS